MTMIVTAILFCVALAGVALRADTRLRDEKRLPMQWWLDGEVTWSAPRAMALAFIPALALCVFTMLIILFASIPPRHGQEDMVLPTVIGFGTALLAAQALHLWLIEKTLRRNGR